MLLAILDEGKKTSSSQKVPYALANFQGHARISTVSTFKEGRTIRARIEKVAVRDRPWLESRETDSSSRRTMNDRLRRRDYRLIEEWSEGLGQGALQDFAQQFVFLLTEFFAAFRQIEDVNSFLTLSVDQGYVNIAAEAGEGGANIVKKAGAVLHHDFKERAMGGRGVVIADAGFDGYLGRFCFAGALAAFEQRFKRRFSVDDVRKTLLEAGDLAGV